MGRRRKKKSSVRCKTSKREKKHKQKEMKSPAVNQYHIPLNEIIDHHGKSSTFLHKKLMLKQKDSILPKKRRIAFSPADKIKINRFLFGHSANHNENKNDKTIEDMFSNKEKELLKDDNSKYDILKISNLSSRVNEKIIAKIINKLLSQNSATTNTQQISLKSISILSTGSTQMAKIKLKKLSSDVVNTLALRIIELLNGKKLFGQVLKCEAVSK
eukprot:UN01071